MPVSTGHLLYVRQGSLFAAPFDLNKLAITGAAVPLVEGIFASNTGGAFLDLADNGSLLYAPGRATTGGFVIALVDKSGKSTMAQAATGTYLYPAFSSDGKRLSYIASRPGGADVWVKEIERDVTTRLTLLFRFRRRGLVGTGRQVRNLPNGCGHRTTHHLPGTRRWLT